MLINELFDAIYDIDQDIQNQETALYNAVKKIEELNDKRYDLVRQIQDAFNNAPKEQQLKLEY